MEERRLDGEVGAEVHSWLDERQGDVIYTEKDLKIYLSEYIVHEKTQTEHNDSQKL